MAQNGIDDLIENYNYAGEPEIQIDDTITEIDKFEKKLKNLKESQLINSEKKQS